VETANIQNNPGYLKSILSKGKNIKRNIQRGLIQYLIAMEFSLVFYRAS